MTNKLTVSQLYQAAVEQMPPEHIDHTSFNSDLYLKVTPISEALIANYEYKNQVHIFRDNIDHVPWYDIPFGYPGNYTRR